MLRIVPFSCGCLLNALLCASVFSEEAPILLERRAIAVAAREQSQAPVHPGSPEGTPFWNGRARKFVYAPAFEFGVVEGATSYRFTARSGADFESYVFTAEKPWADLGPIWVKLPVGMVELTVEGLKNEQVVGRSGTRKFYKDSPFQGPYRAAIVSYRESAHRLLAYTLRQPFITHWLQEGKPDPGFAHYSYPSKVIGAVIEAMTLAIRENLPEKETARQIGDKAAAFLMRTSLPADSKLPYFPLTYDLDYVKTPVGAAKSYDGQMMMFYPAEVGLQYLDYYEVTKDAALLEAAKRIADTYVKTQLPSGTWPIKVKIETGEAMGDSMCIPVHIVRFLHTLSTKYKLEQYARPCQAAFDWIMQNSVRTFNWEGQFEDINQNQPPYQNLSARAAALYFVIYLHENFAGDAEKMRIARELLRFSEDQFVVWERPAPALRPDLFDEKPGHGRLDDRQIGDTSTWITPVVLEQYSYYVPIGTSGSVVLEAFAAAWRTEGDAMDLAKMMSFANNMTYIQAQHGEGGIPTHWAVTHKGCYGWINNLASQARALLCAANAVEGRTIGVMEVRGSGCSHVAAGTPCSYAAIGKPCPYTANAIARTKAATKPAK